MHHGHRSPSQVQRHSRCLNLVQLCREAWLALPDGVDGSHHATLPPGTVSIRGLDSEWLSAPSTKGIGPFWTCWPRGSSAIEVDGAQPRPAMAVQEIPPGIS